VGELLADSDALSRETLLDIAASQGPAMLRTFGQVVDAAARLWADIPFAPLAVAPKSDVMTRLRAIGDGIARTASVGRWPGPGPTDDRLLEIAKNLSRARRLVQRYGGDVNPSTAEIRADIAAARARIMHTLYVTAHGAALAISHYAKDLRDRLDIDIRRRSPMTQRPNIREIHAA
jgi:hypothetical protein